MSAEELCASIEVYQTQLKQIEDALGAASADEKQQLQELQENLLQLLDLTLQQLNGLSSNETTQHQHETSNITEKAEDEESSSSESDNKSIDDEFALFQSEIAELTGSCNEEKSEPKYSKDYLRGLEGTKCRSPFTEKWGGHSYHNAVILDIVLEEDGEMDLENPKVRVLFSQPTSLEMLTCRFFMSGRCKYSEDSCRFSHGKIVALSDIKDYRTPVYESVVQGSRVLVQHSEDLWTTATVEDILEDRSAFCVKYDHSKKVAEVHPEHMVPMVCEDSQDDDKEALSHRESDLEDGSNEGGNQCEFDQEDSDDENTIFVPTKTWLQHSLTQRLGDWEKYTTGIGSKLMQKMGYIVGTGLGPSGEGRVEPVVAYVYPQGVSLDRCMELREASNGEELLQVEKRMEREKRIEEAKSIQAAERLRKRTSVFDIINKKLGGTADNDSDDDEDQRPTLNVSKSALQKDSAKDLNMKNYRLSENIRQLQKEIYKIEQSKERQSNNKAALQVIETKLQSKRLDLHKMQEAERKVQGEQKHRKDAKKYCVF